MPDSDPDDRCTLCSLPTPEDPVTAEGVEGSFCCRGCLTVARELDEAAVDAETDERAIREAAGADPDPDADGEEAFLAVEGMHCSTCEAFLEGVATSEPGVVGAEASYASELLRVEYDPDRVDAADLPELVSGAGYEATRPEDRPEAPDGEAELVRFLIGGGFFGMMAMLYYALFLYPTYFGYESLVNLEGFDGLYLFGQLWLLTTLVLFYTGFPILRGAWVSLRVRRPNTDLLVSLAAVGAYSYSTLAMLLGRTDLYFDVTVAIVLVVTAGNYYERRVKRDRRDLLSELSELRVEEAIRHPSGERVPVGDVKAGDRLRVPAGERVPVDGEVIEGVAAVDEALVTGESVPETKRPGDRVRGGTVVTNAGLVIEAADGAESTLDRLVDTLWRLQSADPGAQRLADRLSTVFVPLVLAVAAGTAGWLLVSGAAPIEALLGGLTVLIVSCPCALGLATPLAVATGLREGADRGIVVTGEDAFEAAPEADVVAFDKTGTLTEGRMEVAAVVPADRALADGGAAPVGSPAPEESGTDDLLARAAALERYSSHPVAEAITTAADAVPDAAEDVEIHARGVSGRVRGRPTLVGHPSLFRERDWTLPNALADRARSEREAGRLPVLVGWDGRARGLVAVADSPRRDWDRVLARVGEDHEVVVLTGDDESAAERFREHRAVDRVFAGVPPDGKAETVRRLGADRTVAMVGDGSNDAPALAAADLGIALGGGTALATDAADAVLVGDDLRRVPETVALLRGTRRRIRENLAWAFCYNAAAIPMAAAGLLNPLLAALAMATSSLLVVANSTRPVLD